MESIIAARPEVAPQPTRVIGRLEGDQPGPSLVCIASMHGNEPAGFKALHQVFEELAVLQPRVRGQFVGLTGNLSALAAGERYIDRDLNRHWSADRIERLRRRPAGEPVDTEDSEALALLTEIEQILADATGETYVVDLHTTSGDSPPFATIGDTLRNRKFALKFPVPVVLGLEEHLDGTMLEYLNGFGPITMGFEGGQHDDPLSVEHCRAGVWEALAASGVLEAPDRFAPVERSRLLLAEATDWLPRVVEVRYRHGLSSGSRFHMRPGYMSFQPVAAGEALAQDALGEYRAPERGLILMPLYQPLGDDGFFLVRPFRPFWLAVSALLRHLRIDAVIHWLPGVQRLPTQPDTFTVDLQVARYFALQVFHLLGYRKKRLEGNRLFVSRRRHDLPGT